MEDYRSLSHTKWQCKYHIVFIPKYRRRQLYGVVRKHLGEVFHRLAKHKECWIEEGHVMPDHVHIVDQCAAEIGGIERGGIHQGQECDSRGEALFEERAKLAWASDLGPRFLRRYGWTGYRNHPQVHSRARDGGSQARSA